MGRAPTIGRSTTRSSWTHRLPGVSRGSSTSPRPSPNWPRAGRFIHAGRRRGQAATPGSDGNTSGDSAGGAAHSGDAEASPNSRSSNSPIGECDRQPQYPAFLSPDDLNKAAEGDIDGDEVRSGLGRVRNHAERRRLRRAADRVDPTCHPDPCAHRKCGATRSCTCPDWNCRPSRRVDLGNLYTGGVTGPAGCPMSPGARWNWAARWIGTTDERDTDDFGYEVDPDRQVQQGHRAAAPAESARPPLPPPWRWGGRIRPNRCGADHRPCRSASPRLSASGSRQ